MSQLELFGDVDVVDAEYAEANFTAKGSWHSPWGGFRNIFGLVTLASILGTIFLHPGFILLTMISVPIFGLTATVYAVTRNGRPETPPKVTTSAPVVDVPAPLSLEKPELTRRVTMPHLGSTRMLRQRIQLASQELTPEELTQPEFIPAAQSLDKSELKRVAMIYDLKPTRKNLAQIQLASRELTPEERAQVKRDLADPDFGPPPVDPAPRRRSRVLRVIWFVVKWTFIIATGGAIYILYRLSTPSSRQGSESWNRTVVGTAVGAAVGYAVKSRPPDRTSDPNYISPENYAVLLSQPDPVRSQSITVYGRRGIAGYIDRSGSTIKYRNTRGRTVAEKCLRGNGRFEMWDGNNRRIS